MTFGEAMLLGSVAFGVAAVVVSVFEGNHRRRQRHRPISWRARERLNR